MYDVMNVILNLWNITKRLFNRDHEVIFWTKAGEFWVIVGLNTPVPDGVFSKQWVCQITSPAGKLIGNGDSPESAYSDAIKAIQK